MTEELLSYVELAAESTFQKYSRMVQEVLEVENRLRPTTLEFAKVKPIFIFNVIKWAVSRCTIR